MAETGIMGSSGEFRVNSKSASGGSGGGGLIGQAAGIIAESGARRQRMSHEQFLAVAHHASIESQGKQTRMTMAAAAKLQMRQAKQAKLLGGKTFSGNYQTGEHSFTFKEPRTRQPRTAPPTAPSAPAATPTARAAQKFNARNPHPNNPFDKGTKEHKAYNTGSSSQRSTMTRRFKQGMK